MADLPIDPNIKYAEGHAPTIIDYLNASKYALNIIQKSVCDENPNLYKWDENLETAYYCPSGLNCLSGNPAFTKSGCESTSVLPYIDCVRDADGICKYSEIGSWLPVKNNGKLPGQPITVCSTSATTFCTIDSNCPGGTCSTVGPYLEWYDSDVKIGDKTIPGNKCYYTLSQNRQWCEMPWLRTKATKKSDINWNSGDGKVSGEWKTTDVPSFYYNKNDGSCKTTKTYCNHFGNKFGNRKNYFLFEACNPTDKKIDKDSDCCVNIGKAIGQFFFGRTITECITNPKDEHCQKILRFYCDPQLKRNIQKMKDNFLPGLNMYMFEWNEKAQKLGLKGKSLGFLSTEMKRQFPHLVFKDDNGYEYLHYDPKKCSTDKNFKKVCMFMNMQPFVNSLL